MAYVARGATSTKIPCGDTVLEEDDRVIAVSSRAGEEASRRILCGA